MREVFDCGPDPARHLALINAGPDPEGFFDFFATELAEPLRSLKPQNGQ